MNKVPHLLCVIAATTLLACEQPVAEIGTVAIQEKMDNAGEIVLHPKFENECASWDSASIRVSTFADHWVLAGFENKACTGGAKFEHRYELDSQFSGVWRDSLLIDVGTADADREMYLLDSGSGDRIGELWYVGQPIFSDQAITYFEPTREKAVLSQCPQDLPDLKSSQNLGAVIMYSTKKKFDLNSRNITELKGRGCYAMR
ncbi:hypothetical protein [Microbulbifer elongatus]|uniref:hypothetical protein n=1 Tax=Microbulbifer elongatus TaxID=86173 RepID=UPI001E587EBA|nr:hypothetical protein [Microbulbifer elongatus]